MTEEVLPEGSIMQFMNADTDRIKASLQMARIKASGNKIIGPKICLKQSRREFSLAYPLLLKELHKLADGLRIDSVSVVFDGDEYAHHEVHLAK